MAEEPRMEVLRQSSRRYGHFFFSLFFFSFAGVFLPVCVGHVDHSAPDGSWSLLTCSLFVVNLWWIRRQDADQEVKEDWQ